jgi:hypothetical protein
MLRYFTAFFFTVNLTVYTGSVNYFRAFLENTENENKNINLINHNPDNPPHQVLPNPIIDHNTQERKEKPVASQKASQKYRIKKIKSIIFCSKNANKRDQVEKELP